MVRPSCGVWRNSACRFAAFTSGFGRCYGFHSCPPPFRNWTPQVERLFLRFRAFGSEYCCLAMDSHSWNTGRCLCRICGRCYANNLPGLRLELLRTVPLAQFMASMERNSLECFAFRGDPVGPEQPVACLTRTPLHFARLPNDPSQHRGFSDAVETPVN